MDPATTTPGTAPGTSEVHGGETFAPSPKPAQAAPVTPAPATPAPAKKPNPWASRPAAQAAPVAQPAPKPAAAKDDGSERRREANKFAKDLRAKDDELARLRPAAAEAAEYRESVAALAKTQLATLPENVRKYILATAGDNPAKQIKAISAAAENGLIGGQPTGATTGHDPKAQAETAKVETDEDVIKLRNLEKLQSEGKNSMARTYEFFNRESIASGRKKAAALAAKN